MSRRLNLPVVAAFLLVVVPTAWAASPTPANGTLAPGGTPTLTGVHTADGNTFITQRAPLILTGTFAGTAILEQRIVVHPGGLTTFEAWQTFSGTVNGLPGTVLLRIVGSGDATSFHGYFIVVSATGNLTGLHGEGTFTISAQTGVGTYTGQVEMP